VTNASGSELTRTTDESGTYEFKTLSPGSYVLEIEPATLPPDFRQPGRRSWRIAVLPIQAVYLDVPISAQRAVSGIVFIDKDGDGQFDPQKDEAIDGGRVIGGTEEVMTGPGGSYILRSLPAGTVTISACVPAGRCSPPATIQLSVEPTIRRGVNFVLSTKSSAANP
jgi:protocatechuate 3,4-dioxygenase beta subunit